MLQNHPSHNHQVDMLLIYVFFLFDVCQTKTKFCYLLEYEYYHIITTVVIPRPKPARKVVKDLAANVILLSSHNFQTLIYTILQEYSNK